MIVVKSVTELQAWRRSVPAGVPVVLVPTMGALHAGHMALVDQARKCAGPEGKVVVSLFVNPIQFGPGEDLEAYPRPFEHDETLCREAGVDLLYAPCVEDMYATDRSVTIGENRLSQGLCGRSRPGHFDGVCTVVAKLFLRTRATDAVFGKKDYQQLAIIRRMVRDLDLPVKIHAGETVREPDGLALSSRNRYLSVEERQQAPALRQGLLQARLLYLSGVTDPEALKATVRESLRTHASCHRIDYLEVVHRGTLEPVDQVDGDSLIVTAVFFGKARLLDNLEM
jgi:pantoate--beta-alanine ligase